MKTKRGFYTDGEYVKWKSAYTSFWIVEVEEDEFIFRDEESADAFIEDYLYSGIYCIREYKNIPGLVFPEQYDYKTWAEIIKAV